MSITMAATIMAASSYITSGDTTAGAVERDDGMRAGCDPVADFGQMQVHRVAVGGEQHNSGIDTAGRADGADQIGSPVAGGRGAPAVRFPWEPRRGLGCPTGRRRPRPATRTRSAGRGAVGQ